MTETILYLFAAVLILAVLRSVIGVVFKGISDFFAAASPSPPHPARETRKPDSLVEALVKDPVCGTFLPASAPIRKTVNGKTYCFCSPECRDKFQG